LSEEDVKALQNATQNLNLTSASQTVGGAAKATSALLGAESDLLKKIPPTANVSLEITDLDTGVTVLSGIMTAAEAFEIMSNLTDSDPGNDPDMSDWAHIGGDIAETGLDIWKATESARGSIETASGVSKAIPYIGAGINVVMGSVDVYQAVTDYFDKNKNVSDLISTKTSLQR